MQDCVNFRDEWQNALCCFGFSLGDLQKANCAQFCAYQRLLSATVNCDVTESNPRVCSNLS